MAAKTNLTMTSDVQVTAREIDFVTRFARNWQHLRDILGIMRPIKKQPGTVLKAKTASVTLAQSVGEGEEIPYSKATVIEKDVEGIDPRHEESRLAQSRNILDRLVGKGSHGFGGCRPRLCDCVGGVVGDRRFAREQAGPAAARP